MNRINQGADKRLDNTENRGFILRADAGHVAGEENLINVFPWVSSQIFQRMLVPKYVPLDE